jgi:HK97 family phage major capsid protein
MADETKQLLDEMKSTFEQFKTRDAQAAAEAKKLGETTTETKTALNALQTKLDELEVKMKRASVVGSGSRGDETKGASSEIELKAFDQYFRKGDQRLTADELKALSSDSDSDGGFMVPTTRATRMIELLREASDIRALATVETIATGSDYEIPADGPEAFEAGWVGERQERTETQAGKLAMRKIPTHEMYANPYVTRTLLDDTGFDVDGWMSRRVTGRFAQIEGVAFLNGDGVGKPFGLMAPAGIAEVVTGAAATIKADALIDLVYDLPEAYAKNGTLIMRRSTVREIRKLKDSNGQYLWQPGVAGGAPATIIDRPYREVPDMPAIAAGTFPILFGDFRAGYVIVDRQGIRLIRDELTKKPFVQMYTTKRTGGQVVLPEAFRKLKVSA